jgi:sugar (pentulose or hexulose) kinase
LSKLDTSSFIYIGIDAGTSGIRLCAIDAQANILCEITRVLPPPKVIEQCISQDARVWSTGLFELLDELKAIIDLKCVRAVAIDGTSGTVLLTDANAVPLSDALMYNDASSRTQVERMRVLCPDIHIVHAVSAGLPKALQLAEQVDINKVKYIMHQADWLQYQFTHAAGHSDSNNCLKTGYDATRHIWPECIRKLASIGRWLPRVHRSGEDIAPVAHDVAERYGFSTQTMVRAGTTDSTAAVIATGAAEIGDAITSLGSTLVMKVISDTPITDTRYGVYSQPYGNHWLVGGGSNSGGAVLRRYFTDAQMRELSKHVDTTHDSGLNYYPLNQPGERFPINDPDLPPRLTPHPEKDALFFQGLLEGMAQIEHSAYERLAQLGAPYPKRVFSIGGGAINEKWAQIRQRYLQTAMQVCHHTSAAYGSALLARQPDLKK